MAINIMDRLDKDFELESGLGGTIMDKLNAAIVSAGGEAHVGTIADRIKALHEAQAEVAADDNE